MKTLKAEIFMDLLELNETLNDILDMEAGQQENVEEKNKISRLATSGDLYKTAWSNIVPLDQTIG